MKIFYLCLNVSLGKVVGDRWSSVERNLIVNLIEYLDLKGIVKIGRCGDIVDRLEVLLIV